MGLTEDRAFELLERAYQRDRLAHAYLISGPAGSGKQNLAARIVDLVNERQEGLLLCLQVAAHHPID